MDNIFETENFSDIKICFTKSMKLYEGSYYAAFKLMEAGYRET